MIWLNPHLYSMKLAPSIRAPELKHEIARRGISIRLANDYLQQCVIKNKSTSKTKTGFAFENNAGGFAIRCPDAKQYRNDKFQYGKEGITVFPAHPEAESFDAVIFDDFWDFLTHLQINGRSTETEYVIANSDGGIDDAAAHVIHRRPRTVLYAPENSPEGERLANVLAEAFDASCVRFGTIEHLYRGHRDYSAMRCSAPGNAVSATPNFAPKLRP